MNGFFGLNPVGGELTFCHGLVISEDIIAGPTSLLPLPRQATSYACKASCLLSHKKQAVSPERQNAGQHSTQRAVYNRAPRSQACPRLNKEANFSPPEHSLLPMKGLVANAHPSWSTRVGGAKNEVTHKKNTSRPVQVVGDYFVYMDNIFRKPTHTPV